MKASLGFPFIYGDSMKYCKHPRKHVLATKDSQLWCGYCGSIKWRYAKTWEYPGFWKRTHNGELTVIKIES